MQSGTNYNTVAGGNVNFNAKNVNGAISHHTHNAHGSNNSDHNKNNPNLIEANSSVIVSSTNSNFPNASVNNYNTGLSSNPPTNFPSHQ